MRQGRGFYQGESGEHYQRSVHGDAIESESVFMAKANLARFRYFKDLTPTKRVLEFGVGIGTNLALLPNQVLDGYDVGEFAREASRARGIRIFDQPEKIEKGAYDVVLCRHVLEHVENPLAVLTSLKSYLARNGYVLLILPVEDTNRMVRTLPAPDVNNHLFAWGPQHIVNLLHAAGLVPTDHRYFWYSMQNILKPVIGLLGIKVYSALVTVAGRLRRQREMAIWAKPGD